MPGPAVSLYHQLKQSLNQKQKTNSMNIYKPILQHEGIEYFFEGKTKDDVILSSRHNTEIVISLDDLITEAEDACYNWRYCKDGDYSIYSTRPSVDAYIDSMLIDYIYDKYDAGEFKLLTYDEDGNP